MKVFISYSRADDVAVEAMAHDLELSGHQVWIDRQIPGGASWWDEILAHVRECDVLIFALSPTSLRSEACRSENGYAQRLGKALLPVEVQTVNRKLLPPELGRFQIVDYRTQARAEFVALLGSLNALPPAPPLPAVMPPPPITPQSYLIKVKQYLMTPYQLTENHQYQILRALAVGVKTPDDRDEAQQLLLELRSRPETTPAITAEIDRVRASNQAVAAIAHPAVGAWTRSQYLVRLFFCLALSPIAALIIWGDNKHIPGRRQQSRRIVVWTLVIYGLFLAIVFRAAGQSQSGVIVPTLASFCLPASAAHEPSRRHPARHTRHRLGGRA